MSSSFSDLFTASSGNGGSSTITDKIADTIGGLVAEALKKVLGNLS